MTQVESVLQEAQRLIHGERATTYGHPRENFKRIADLWTAYLGREIKPLDVGLMMVLMKVARLEQGTYHRDSVTDIAGYAGTLERIFEEPVGPMLSDMPEHVQNAVKWAADYETRYRGNRPRIWKHLADVPSGVEVFDREGDFWKFDQDRTKYIRRSGDLVWEPSEVPNDVDSEEYYPFTEVLDG